jgi:hypothetical protein
MEPRGIEPLTAVAQVPNSQGVREIGPETLAQTLARVAENDPGLASIIDAWPTLPARLKRAILALVSGE